MIRAALQPLGHELVRKQWTVRRRWRKSPPRNPTSSFSMSCFPKKNGFQVCRQLKTDAATADVQIILLTTKGQESDRFWGLKQGADEYMTKPFEDDELAAMVSQQLGWLRIRGSDCPGSGGPTMSRSDRSVPSPTPGLETERLVAAIDSEFASVDAESGRTRKRTGWRSSSSSASRYQESDYLVPIAQLLEVARPESITPIPKSPGWLLGVTNLRGDILSLVDLGAFLEGSRIIDHGTGEVPDGGGARADPRNLRRD